MGCYSSSAGRCNRSVFFFRLQIMAALLLMTCCVFVSLSSSSPSLSENIAESRKMVIGSRPPRCINRCMNCKPCMAALVIPPPRKVSLKQDEENYYLVTWKCRCKNKLFHP